MTGFGLLGHLGEMVLASDAHVVIDPQRLPILPGAATILKEGVQSTLHPGNREAAERYIGHDFNDEDAEILFDPQTSGGLLGAFPGPSAPRVIDALRQGGAIHATAIGYVTTGKPGYISLGRLQH